MEENPEEKQIIIKKKKLKKDAEQELALIQLTGRADAHLSETSF